MTVDGNSTARPEFEIAGVLARPGGRIQVEIPLGRLISGTPVAIPTIVVHGSEPGPTVWVNAATHGDEIGGIEIVRRVLDTLDPRNLAGTFIAVPILNVHGFNTGDRYLPDRRDLNRSFPGSARGSLAARVANLMMTEVVERSDVGIDLHTGTDHRANLPQIRGDLDDDMTRDLAERFGAPIAIHAKNRKGSLRAAAHRLGKPCLLFEGGEAYRFDQSAIVTATDGVLRVLHRLGMIDEIVPPAAIPPIAQESRWVRASSSGIVDCRLSLGDVVERGDEVAVLRDPFGTELGRLKAPQRGMIVGQLQHPLVNKGDAIMHIATLEAAS